MKPREETVSRDAFQASSDFQPQAKLEQQTDGSQAEHDCGCLTTRVLRLRGIHFDIVRQCATRIDCIRYKTFLQTARLDWEVLLDVLLSPMTCEPPSCTDPRSRLDRTTSIAYLLLKYIWEDSRNIVTTLADEIRIGTRPMERRLGSLSRMDPGKIYRVVAALEAYTRKRGIKLTKALTMDLEIAARAEHDLLRKFTNGPREDLGAEVPMGMRDRTFFSTEYGFVGLGPQGLQRGDNIVTVFGASRPFVLRAHGNHHVLVGDAVVPGIMSGQMMALYGDGRIQTEEFLLK